MRTYVLSPDLRGQINGSVSGHLLPGFSEQGSSIHDCDVVLVPVSFFSDFKFNPQLRDIKKPWVLMDYLEYEWLYDFDVQGTHLFGKNTRECRWLGSSAWHELCDFVRDHPPIVYFKRELLAKDAVGSVKPIDWPCYMPGSPLQTEAEFNQRPIEVFFSWGFSHPSRPLLHAEIFKAMTTHSIGVVSAMDQFEGYFKQHDARTWATIFSPWYCRKHISELLRYQRQSKLSVSLFGCGSKCFRHAEAPIDTIMALQHDMLAWSIPWVRNDNCIRISTGSEQAFKDLDEATKRSDLYQIYLRSQETIEQYRMKPYVENYMIPLIQTAL